MKPVVKIENVSKRYLIGGLHPGYITFRETLGGLFSAPFRRWSNKEQTQTIWALEDINLEVCPGELVGIIGHNGAGKSTLLKVLSRVTKPTRGRVELHGRIGSLLEVGTGFHPDLTGRENIYLSGAILGMTREEIRRKFEEIVAFSEIEKFLETPVKRYSSGMYVRLAFSVAAHLEPEILMTDEVLAVGDAAFQQKCLDKMSEIRRQGRTIFFVSHDMAAITRLSKRAVLLEGGKIISDGPTQQVVKAYLSSRWMAAAESTWAVEEAPGNDAARLRRVRVCSEEGATTATVDISRPVGIEIVYDILSDNQVLAPVVELLNEQNIVIFSTHDTGVEGPRLSKAPGCYISTVWIPGNFLAEGSLRAHVSLISHLPHTLVHAHARNVIAFQVIGQISEIGRGGYTGSFPGVIRPVLKWETRMDQVYN